MDSPPTRDARVTPAAGGAGLWLRLWLAPAAWVVVGLVGYLLVARSCEGENGLRAYGVAHPALVVALLAGAGGLASAYAFVHGRSRDGQASGRVRFVAFAGLLASSLFVLAFVYLVVPTFLVDACVQAH